MDTITAKAPLRVQVPAQADKVTSMRRRLRARYPILQDGAILFTGARPGISRFAPSMIQQAVKAVRNLSVPPARPSSVSAHNPDKHAPSEPDRRIFAPARLRKFAAALQEHPPRTGCDYAGISLLEIAPKKLYAHWSLPDSLLAGLRMRLGEAYRNAQQTLRFYEVTNILFDGTNALHTFDLDIHPGEESRYIDLWSTDKTYLVELGLRSADGRFHALARSGHAHAPRDSAAADSQPQFLNVEANRLPLPQPATPARFRIRVHPLLVGENEYDWPLRDMQAEHLVRTAYSAFFMEGPRALRHLPPVVMRPRPILLAEYKGREERRRRQAKSSMCQPAQIPRNAPNLFFARLDIDPECSSHPRKLAHPPALRRSQPHRPVMVSGDQRVISSIFHFTSKSRAQFALPASPSRCLALPAPRTFPALPAPDRSRTTLSPGRSRSRNILETIAAAGLELEAELILRGRVKPGKKVRIGDQVIETEPDGSFCVSCVVIDGELRVPVEVVEAEMVVARQDFDVSINLPN